MKKINRKLIKGTNWALAGLMSFLGFSSCDIIGLSPAEYGTPHADFVISGKVTDMEGATLTGINVAAANEEHCYVSNSDFNQNHVIPEGYRRTISTNEKGEFVYSYSGWSADTVKLKMMFDDKRNNTYESDSATVVFLKSELKGGKGWNEGKVEKNINVRLKRKAGE